MAVHSTPGTRYPVPGTWYLVPSTWYHNSSVEDCTTPNSFPRLQRIESKQPNLRTASRILGRFLDLSCLWSGIWDETAWQRPCRAP
eukprot:COSAG01_NODE_19602_length_1001_cov_0.790466_3_plen_86_part_00